MLNGFIFLPIVIIIFHPAKLLWTNYWTFLKAGGYGLIIFGILGALFNRIKHSKGQLNENG